MSKKVKELLSTLAVVVVVLTIAGLAIWYEVEMWSECRATNTFWYCMRILGK